MSTDNTNAAVAADASTPEVVRPKISDYRRHLLICTGPRCTQDGQAQALFDSLGEKFKAAGFNPEAYTLYSYAAVQVIAEEPYLPIAPIATSEKTATKVDHIMEPDRATIVEEIIPKSLKIQFYKALLDSHAAEHGARMTAMHKATDNADSLLKGLKLTYNKARQAAITNEILEIVGGAEALKG